MHISHYFFLLTFLTILIPDFNIFKSSTFISVSILLLNLLNLINLLLNANNLNNLIKSYIITHNAGNKINIIQPNLLAIKNCTLPNWGILNKTLPKTSFELTVAPSVFKLLSPLVV